MFPNFENPLHHVMHVILIISDLDTCLYLASYYRRSSVLIISHSRNFIVEKLINCCVFHSNFFFYEQHLNHEETWPGYASHCETEDSLLLQRFFGHWSSLFVVFFCLKDFRDDFCCSLSERIGAEFYSL